MKANTNQRNRKKWGTKEFEKEVIRLYDGFMNFCCLWGWIFGGHDDNDSNEVSVNKALQFTRREFPRRHPEFDFKRIFGTLVCVAINEESGCLIVRPEINTIYNGENHDLITPIVRALMNDCLYWARFGEPYLSPN